jgi:hypothetical protein
MGLLSAKWTSGPTIQLARSPPQLSTCGLRHVSVPAQLCSRVLRRRPTHAACSTKWRSGTLWWTRRSQGWRTGPSLRHAPPPAAPPTFPGPRPWDRAAVEIRLDRATLLEWLAEGQCRESFLALAAGKCRNCSLFWALLRSWNGTAWQPCEIMFCL